MRLKAPAGTGNPSIGGIEIKPDDDGVYEVDHHTGRLLVESFGFFDADAPAKSKLAKGDDDQTAAYRAAVAATLRKLGIKVSNDTAALKALADLPQLVDERTLAAVKRAEDDVEAKHAAAHAELQSRAEAAEARLTELDKGSKGEKKA